jgi:nitrogen-specific signal transduction histidine kinase
MKTTFTPGAENEPSSAQFRERSGSRSCSPGEPGAGAPPPLDEVTHHIKLGLSHIKEYARLVEERCVDKRFGGHLRRSLTQEVDKIEGFLEQCGAPWRGRTSPEKRDTVHRLIEVTLAGYEGFLEKRRIKVIKKFEPGLPEPIVPDEPLGFVLNSLLWYALTAVSPVAIIGFLTKTCPLHIVTASQKGTLHRKERHDLEILFVLSGGGKPLEFSGPPVETPLREREGIPGSMLRVIEEIVSSHKGELKVELDSKKAWVLFSLKLPIERRRKASCKSSGND